MPYLSTKQPQIGVEISVENVIAKPKYLNAFPSIPINAPNVLNVIETKRIKNPIQNAIPHNNQNCLLFIAFFIFFLYFYFFFFFFSSSFSSFSLFVGMFDSELII